MANLACVVGPAATFDAVKYSRAMTEDDGATFTVPDSRYTIYLDAVAKDFSRYSPLDDIVGNIQAQTSTLNAVANQQRYVCSSGNGFVGTVTRLVFIQGNTSGLNVTNDLSYFYLAPDLAARGYFSPLTIGEPSRRVVRDSYLDELAALGRTYAEIVRDRTSGALAFDLYPIPTAAFPLYVRYQAIHAQAGSGSNPTYPTIPEEFTQAFGDLLYAQVLYEEAHRLGRSGRVTAGQITLEATAGDLRMLALDVRERVYQQLGGSAPVAIVG